MTWLWSLRRLGMGRTMANLLKCPEFLRTCLTPKMSETSLRYRVGVCVGLKIR